MQRVQDSGDESFAFARALSRLQEMRSAFVLADLERRGGVAQRMSPLASVADCGALMQAAGFALPTVDTDEVVIHYPDAWTLWHHLRAMGESHAVRSRAASTWSVAALYSAYLQAGLAYGPTHRTLHAAWSCPQSGEALGRVCDDALVATRGVRDLNRQRLRTLWRSQLL